MTPENHRPVGPLRVSLVQTDIVWEDIAANMERYRQKIRLLRGESDLVVLPEMCTTGFGSNIRKTARPADGPDITAFQALAAECGLALAGSFACREGDKYYNRGFFIYPDGYTVFFDKCHLFRMGGEADDFTAGEDAVIVTYKGWNIRLAICYDLRFPVWCRNRQPELPHTTFLPEQDEPMENPLEYDLFIVVANWPEGRIHSWTTLLDARATENQCYVCGVNRVGTDGLGLHYPGASAMFNPVGPMVTLPNDEEAVETVTISLKRLLYSRSRFTAWMDADDFTLGWTPEAASEISH